MYLYLDINLNPYYQIFIDIIWGYKNIYEISRKIINSEKTKIIFLFAKTMHLSSQIFKISDFFTWKILQNMFNLPKVRNP